MQYIRFRSGKMQSVHCKGACPTVLVERKFLRGMVKTPMYAEVVIAMRQLDGQLNKHYTSMCRRCRDRLWLEGPQPGELEAIYAQDCEQWAASARRAGLTKEDIATRILPFISRTPIRVLHEYGRGDPDGKRVVR